MAEIRKDWEKYKWWLAFGLGLAAVAVYCLAYPVLGSGSYVQITDQLDGEVINYIYNAKYLFSGQRFVPEFMGGTDISSMTPPTLMGVLFYKLLPPFGAFACMHIFSVLVGYVGMFLLLHSFSKSPLVVFATACLFVYLPFYPVYGLSVLGQPLLVWAFVCMLKGRVGLRHYLGIVLYAVGSSLVLVGFAWLLAGVVVMVILFAKRVNGRKYFAIGYVTLLAAYLLCNVNLFSGFWGTGSAGVSHREEMVITAVADMGKHFKEIFLEGGLYVKSYNTVILILSVAVIVGKLILAWWRKKNIGIQCKLLIGTLGVNLLLALVACAWRLQEIVDLRTQLGGVFRYFQFDRVYWLLPLGWYVALGFSLEILTEGKRIIKALGYGISLLAFLLQAKVVYENSSIWHNLRLMVFPDTYHLMTWEDYYAEDVFAQIEDCIGEDKSDYRVVSLGINPAAALYNGFYCLDGYSNLYPLEYKHEFRKIIEKELDKNGDVAAYFDTWGNRCYLLNSETGNYMTVARGSGTYADVELNVEQLQKMGAEYIFSAMPMENAQDLNLELLRETPFSSSESYYEIWVYKISEGK